MEKQGIRVDENGIPLPPPEANGLKPYSKYDALYPSLAIYQESKESDQEEFEKVRELKEKEKPIIIGNVEVTEEEKEVITLNPKKPIQLEPKLDEFRLDLEVCFLKMRWSPDKIEEYNLLATQLEETPWEELEEGEKQMYIERVFKQQDLLKRT